MNEPMEFMISCKKPRTKIIKKKTKPLLGHDYVNGIQCKPELTMIELMQVGFFFQEKKLKKNKYKADPLKHDYDDNDYNKMFYLEGRYQDEHKEFNEAFCDYMCNPSEKTKIALINEIADCKNFLDFITAKLCGAKRLIRE